MFTGTDNTIKDKVTFNCCSLLLLTLMNPGPSKAPHISLVTQLNLSPVYICPLTFNLSASTYSQMHQLK